MRFHNLVSLVLNGQSGAPTQAQSGNALILRWEPEISGLQVCVMDLGLLDPKRRILGGFTLNSTHREILGIHPDSAAVEKLAGHLGLHRQDVWACFSSSLIREHGEIVVLAIEGDTFGVSGVKSLMFGIEQALEDMTDDPLRAALGADSKFFRGWRSEPYVDSHFGVQIFRKANEIEPVKASTGVALQCIRSLSILLCYSINHLRCSQARLRRTLI